MTGITWPLRRIWDANNDLKLRDCQRAAEVLDPLPVE